MALAESGAEPSLAEIDSDDPVVLRLLSSGAEAIRSERARIELIAAAWYVVELRRGRPIRLEDLQ
jgi:hypothetical protein